MTRIILALFVFFQFDSVGQMIIYSSKDTADYFTVKTLRTSGDSSFVTVDHVKNGKLVQREDQINIRTYATSTDKDSGTPLSVIKTISHGPSIEWHDNGKLKSRGTFYFNKKQSDWKYWSKYGKEISEPKKQKVKVRGGTT